MLLFSRCLFLFLFTFFLSFYIPFFFQLCVETLKRMIKDLDIEVDVTGADFISCVNHLFLNRRRIYLALKNGKAVVLKTQAATYANSVAASTEANRRCARLRAVILQRIEKDLG